MRPLTARARASSSHATPSSATPASHSSPPLQPSAAALQPAAALQRARVSVSDTRIRANPNQDAHRASLLCTVGGLGHTSRKIGGSTRTRTHAATWDSNADLTTPAPEVSILCR